MHMSVCCVLCVCGLASAPILSLVRAMLHSPILARLCASILGALKLLCGYNHGNAYTQMVELVAYSLHSFFEDGSHFFWDGQSFNCIPLVYILDNQITVAAD